MKKILILVISCFFIIPNVVFALEGYETKNLEETLDSEKIERNLSGYQESDDQVTIYMFRGDGCGFCQKFLTFLNSIVPEYGKYFKLVSFEVWYDKENAKLMNEVADFLGETANGVPFIIIGDQVFGGYSSEFDDAIKKKIQDEYAKEEKYDVFKEIEKQKQEQNKPDHSTTWIILANLVFIAGATGIILYNNSKNRQAIEEKIDQIAKELKKDKKEENKKKEKKKEA